jgi:hypothetical protein
MDTCRIRAGLHWLLAGALAAAMVAVAPRAAAQEDPPGRVGRIAELKGAVSWFDHESGRWAEAERNRPLTGGDRISTGPDSRAELRVGSSTLRLGAGAELEVLRLDDERMAFQLHAGPLAVRVRSREVASEIDIVTAEARLAPQRSGHYRIDRIDDSTFAAAWRGDLRVEDAQGFTIAPGQRAELYRERRGSMRELRSTWVAMPTDSFSDWVARDDRRDDERSASQRFVSPEMTGAEDLDHYGQWSRHPDYGPIWHPTAVAVGWAPYRYGRWAWVRPWGWTWVDEAPWGFAPFHYGRWVWWGSRWGWVPGAYVARPAFAPALVAWVGGPNWSVSVNLGGPAVGWVPLAPREVYVPWYRHSPRYVDRVYAPGWQPPQRTVPTGPIMYSNQGVPGAVTVVPKDVLVQRQPVGRAVVSLPPEVVRAPVTVGQAPPAWGGPNGNGNGRGEPRQLRDGRDGRAPQAGAPAPVTVAPPMGQPVQPAAQPAPPVVAAPPRTVQAQPPVVALPVQPAQQVQPASPVQQVQPAPAAAPATREPPRGWHGPAASPAPAPRAREGEPHGEVIDLRRVRPPQAAAPAAPPAAGPAPQQPMFAPARPQAPPPQAAPPRPPREQGGNDERKRVPDRHGGPGGRGERER